MRRVVAVLRNTSPSFSNIKQTSINGACFKLQHLRQFGMPAPACWNCKKQSVLKQNMLCSDCGHLQDVDANINYFDLLNLPVGFSMEAQKLTQHFRQLQSLVHPDKYSNKTTREQTNSADWSSLINKAYKTLAAPVERGQYMLQLEGEQMPQDNSALNATFLMAMMERNEEVEDANDSETLEQLNIQIAKELSEHSKKLTPLFETKDLAAVKATLVEMKYLLSIQSSIKQKQQHLLAA